MNANNLYSFAKLESCPMRHHCLNCGMRVGNLRVCPKCDEVIAQQTDNSTRTADIAHHHETRVEAVAKLHREIAAALNDPARYLRLIVGTGLIRDEIGAELEACVRLGKIRSYRLDDPNPGAFLVEMKPRRADMPFSSKSS